MTIVLYCESVQKTVRRGISAGTAGANGAAVTSYAVNLSTHAGDGVSVDKNIQAGTFGFTINTDTRPEFDAGDLVTVEITLKPAEVPASPQS